MSDHELTIREKVYLIAATTHVLDCDPTATTDSIMLSAYDKLIAQAQEYEAAHPGTMESIATENEMVVRLRGGDG